MYVKKILNFPERFFFCSIKKVLLSIQLMEMSVIRCKCWIQNLKDDYRDKSTKKGFFSYTVYGVSLVTEISIEQPRSKLGRCQARVFTFSVSSIKRAFQNPKSFWSPRKVPSWDWCFVLGNVTSFLIQEIALNEAIRLILDCALTVGYPSTNPTPTFLSLVFISMVILNFDGNNYYF